MKYEINIYDHFNISMKLIKQFCYFWFFKSSLSVWFRMNKVMKPGQKVNTEEAGCSESAVSNKTHGEFFKEEKTGEYQSRTLMGVRTSWFSPSRTPWHLQKMNQTHQRCLTWSNFEKLHGSQILEEKKTGSPESSFRVILRTSSNIAQVF